MSNPKIKPKEIDFIIGELECIAYWAVKLQCQINKSIKLIELRNKKKTK